MTTPDGILPLSGPELKNKGYALFCTNTAADNARSDQCVVQRIESTLVTDGGTAGTAVTEECIVSFPFTNSVKVLGCTVLAPVAVTASDTLFATFTLSSRDANGANAVTIATQTTKTSGSGGLGSLTAFKPAALPVTVANAVVPAGGSLTIAVAKASTGTAIASATAQCLVQVYLEEL